MKPVILGVSWANELVFLFKKLIPPVEADQGYLALRLRKTAFTGNHSTDFLSFRL